MYNIITLSFVPGVINGTRYIIQLRISNYYGGKTMNLRNLFSRNVTSDLASTDKSKHQVTCDTSTIRDLITEWINNEGWRFENFADFVNLIGLQTPVKLSNLDQENHSFQCCDALNKEVLLSLKFGDFLDYSPEIRITSGEETKIYVPNTHFSGEETIPAVTLEGRIITRDGKKLISYYSQYFCQRTLYLDATHILTVEIDEPDKCNEKSKILVLRNCADVENYLLGLNGPIVSSQVYDTVMQLLGFSEDDITKSRKILISYVEKVDYKEIVLSKIFITDGKMQEYAVLDDGEVFHLFSDGCWDFHSECISIHYSQKNKQYIFSITGLEENIANTKINEVILRVNKKISELWKFMR